jgi:hypothetical protein
VIRPAMHCHHHHMHAHALRALAGWWWWVWRDEQTHRKIASEALMFNEVRICRFYNLSFIHPSSPDLMKIREIYIFLLFKLPVLNKKRAEDILSKIFFR